MNEPILRRPMFGPPRKRNFKSEKKAVAARKFGIFDLLVGDRQIKGT